MTRNARTDAAASMKKTVRLCSCGSGRPADTCCRTKRLTRLVVVLSLIVVTGSGLAALSFSTPPGAAAQEQLARDPVDGYYDAVNDRHWHAGHGHWHPGRPPAAGSLATGLGSGTGTTTVGSGSPFTPSDLQANFSTSAGTTGTVGASPSTPGGATPEPWYYDPATDKHWHAPHGHWHNGPPPPPDQRN